MLRGDLVKLARQPSASHVLRYQTPVARTVQSEIRVMSIECEKVKGINLAQGVCDTEVPEAVRTGAKLATARRRAACRPTRLAGPASNPY